MKNKIKELLKLRELKSASGAIYSPGITDFVFMVDKSSYMFVTGTSIDQSGMFAQAKDTSDIKGELLAQLAFAVAVLGAVIGFLRLKLKRLLHILLGAAGAVLLFLLKNKITSEFLREGENVQEITLGFDIGFWLSLALFIAIAVINLMPAVKKEQTQPQVPPSAATPDQPPAT